MCGRYRRKSDKQRIAEAFHVNGSSIDSLMLTSNDDIRPTTFQPIIRADEEGAPLTELARWGFVPFWQKGTSSRRPHSTHGQRASRRLPCGGILLRPNASTRKSCPLGPGIDTAKGVRARIERRPTAVGDTC